jgi:adenylate cyclase class 2
MPKGNEEQEVKFYLSDLPALQRKLQQLGELRHERILEYNLRFDTADDRLSSAHKVLRLRQDERIRMTYKGPADPTAAVARRTEIEFEVSSFASARRLLEALGYRVVTSYEKYRTTYLLAGAEVVLDELPYGNFCEIEGRDEQMIRAVAVTLGLEWKKRCLKSYLQLFQELKCALDLHMNELSFTAFKGLAISAADLRLAAGDTSKN